MLGFFQQLATKLYICMTNLGLFNKLNIQLITGRNHASGLVAANATVSLFTIHNIAKEFVEAL